MSDNLALWHAVEKTDPRHTKPIVGKAYSGNSPKPHYLVHKATETFGPIGIGWGFSIVSERIEEGAGGDRMHFAHVRVWYEWDGKRGEVEHVGGTQFSGLRSSGKPFTDEDAPKKSVTDALVKALSMIGFAGDIFMGRFDDSKYITATRAEFEQAEAQAAPEAQEQPEPMPNTAAKVHWKTIADQMFDCTTLKQLQGAWNRHYRVYEQLPEDLQVELRKWKDELKDKLMAAAQPAIPPNFDKLETAE
tara:strand:- start:6243 stop:6983 length:741 start_codon:yes stop_codon:yes gene_type:complete